MAVLLLSHGCVMAVPWLFNGCVMAVLWLLYMIYICLTLFQVRATFHRWRLSTTSRQKLQQEIRQCSERCAFSAAAVWRRRAQEARGARLRQAFLQQKVLTLTHDVFVILLAVCDFVGCLWFCWQFDFQEINKWVYEWTHFFFSKDHIVGTYGLQLAPYNHSASVQ